MVAALQKKPQRGHRTNEIVCSLVSICLGERILLFAFSCILFNVLYPALCSKRLTRWKPIALALCFLLDVSESQQEGILREKRDIGIDIFLLPPCRVEQKVTTLLKVAFSKWLSSSGSNDSSFTFLLFLFYCGNDTEHETYPLHRFLVINCKYCIVSYRHTI